MVSLGADRIFAHEGTITGSIGVLLQMAEVTELADQIGVNFLSYKSSELKGVPSPFEKPTARVDQVIGETISESYQYFRHLVQKERDFDESQIDRVSDGRVFTGRRALELGLVDAIGGEEEAFSWLVDTHEIDAETKIRTVDLVFPQDRFREFFSQVSTFFTSVPGVANNGLISVWNP